MNCGNNLPRKTILFGGRFIEWLISGENRHLLLAKDIRARIVLASAGSTRDVGSARIIVVNPVFIIKIESAVGESG